MRIISGKYKGKRITAPENLPVRPTTDRAKEALFSILDSWYYFDGKNVLDLFSGTGNIAFEFSSRGAEHITTVDSNKNCVNFIKKTSSDLELNITSLKSDCIKYLESCEKQFNIIFADPPYSFAEHKKIKEIIFERDLVKKDGCLIIEHDSSTSFEDDNVEVRKYGTVHFSIFSF
ncbi:MAG: RsmD family RNA methyltransferase [Flavobacteriales bacterium]